MTATIVGILATAALVAAGAGADRGKTHTVASGVVMHSDTEGFAWQLRVERHDIRRIPGLCIETDHSWDAAGTSFGNVSTRCVAGRKGNRFSLHAGRCHGVLPAVSTGSIGERTIRKLAFALDQRARRIRVRFPDGTSVTARAHRVPSALRLPARLAWHFDAGTALPTRVTAYNKKRKVVGRWKKGSTC